jgi:glucose/mannose-6-phosphate isomerase
MGGSHLAATLLTSLLPSIIIHRDYGLPRLDPKDLRQSLIVLVSYSGNTEEILDGLEEAMRHDLPVVIITTGGQLLEQARLHNLPLVHIPESPLQPRDALGYQLRALKVALRTNTLPSEVPEPSPEKIKTWMQNSRHLIDHLHGRIGLVYGTSTTQGLAYIWKITLNETGKIPAHYNIFPELNHNELESFGASMNAKNYAGLIITSLADRPQIKKRASITESLLTQFFPVQHRLVSKLSLEDFLIEISIAQNTAKALAEKRNLNPKAVPTIEAFKKDMLR